MKITAVVENHTISEELEARHGLCLHIGMPGQSILFDLGFDGLFLKNAAKLGLDVGAVNMVVLSHGHADHGGALPHFLEHNQTAPVYVRGNAFRPLYHYRDDKYVYAGLKAEYSGHPQLVLTGESHKINDNISLFSGVKPKSLNPESNKFLFRQEGAEYIFDDFSHEQNMLISTAGQRLLFAGCAHCGIVNILNEAEKLADGPIDIVIGGFHLFNPGKKENEKDELISAVARELKKRKTRFYTCHCTGKYAYELMKETLGGQIDYFATGAVLDI